MKKINTLLQNETVKATLVIAAFFVLTALVTLYAMSVS